ncbi:MAG: 2-oxo acid dehydrogenase subunit E2 [Firmicutes bacterium]|nr:2-oxo acid dehydrogenase subunit E2 [Bacillota bacterium]
MRKEGQKVKNVNGFSRVATLLVGTRRCEATNYFTKEVLCKKFDDYIELKKKEGKEYNYRDIALAVLVRIFYLRPQLNRFVVKGKIYQRHHVDVACTVHKNLRTGEKETAIKCRFHGNETLDEVKERVDSALKKAVFEENSTDKFVDSLLGRAPNFLLRFIVWTFRIRDRWGLLSDKFMFETSPMHTSIFYGDLKSIHLGATWHHLYEFGNCGFFLTMGKETWKPVVCQKTQKITAEKVVELGISIDERFIDGLTYSQMLKTIDRILEDLTVLETPALPEDRKWPYNTSEKLKRLPRRAKKQARRAGLTIAS